MQNEKKFIKSQNLLESILRGFSKLGTIIPKTNLRGLEAILRAYRGITIPNHSQAIY